MVDMVIVRSTPGTGMFEAPEENDFRPSGKDGPSSEALGGKDMLYNSALDGLIDGLSNRIGLKD